MSTPASATARWGGGHVEVRRLCVEDRAGWGVRRHECPNPVGQDREAGGGTDDPVEHPADEGCPRRPCSIPLLWLWWLYKRGA